jgi:hypothetical protein
VESSNTDELHGAARSAYATEIEYIDIPGNRGEQSGSDYDTKVPARDMPSRETPNHQRSYRGHDQPRPESKQPRPKYLAILVLITAQSMARYRSGS